MEDGLGAAGSIPGQLQALQRDFGFIWSFFV